MDGGAPPAPPLINYQFYIKKNNKIHRKTCNKYVKICIKILTKKHVYYIFEIKNRAASLPPGLAGTPLLRVVLSLPNSLSQTSTGIVSHAEVLSFPCSLKSPKPRKE